MGESRAGVFRRGVEEINARTLDMRGRPENEAQKEKKWYDLRGEKKKLEDARAKVQRSSIRSADKGH